MAAVQYTFTHKQYTERHKTNSTQNKTTIWKYAGRAPSLRDFTLAFPLQLRKKHGTKFFITFSRDIAKSGLEFNSFESKGRIITRTAKGLFPIKLTPRRARKKSSRKIYDGRFLGGGIFSETSRSCK